MISTLVSHACFWMLLIAFLSNCLLWFKQKRFTFAVISLSSCGAMGFSLFVLWFQPCTALAMPWVSISNIYEAFSLNLRPDFSLLLLMLLGLIVLNGLFLFFHHNLNIKEKSYATFLTSLCFFSSCIIVFSASIPTFLLGWTLQSLAYYFLSMMNHEQTTWSRFSFASLLMDMILIFAMMGLSIVGGIESFWGTTLFLCLFLKHGMAIGFNFYRLFRGADYQPYLAWHFSLFRLVVLSIWAQTVFKTIDITGQVMLCMLGAFSLLSASFHAFTGKSHRDSESLIRLCAAFALLGLSLLGWPSIIKFLMVSVLLNMIHYHLEGLLFINGMREDLLSFIRFGYNYFRWVCFCVPFIFLGAIGANCSFAITGVISFLLGLFFMSQNNMRLAKVGKDLLFSRPKPSLKVWGFFSLIVLWLFFQLLWFFSSIPWWEISSFLQTFRSWICVGLIFLPSMVRYFIEKDSSWFLWVRKHLGNDFVERVEGSFYTIYEIMIINPFRYCSSFLSQNVDQFIFEDRLFFAMEKFLKAIDIQSSKSRHQGATWSGLWIFALFVFFTLLFQVI